MVNAGKRYSKVLPDQWTVVTKDRSLSAQWEHTLLVTETGVEILTLREEETLERVIFTDKSTSTILITFQIIALKISFQKIESIELCKAAVEFAAAFLLAR